MIKNVKIDEGNIVNFERERRKVMERNRLRAEYEDYDEDDYEEQYANRRKENNASRTSTSRQHSSNNKSGKKSTQGYGFKTLAPVIVAAVIIGGIIITSEHTNVTELPNGAPTAHETLVTNVTDLNDLNLVLVDDGVDDTFLNSFSSSLASEGVSFQIVDGSENISNVNGSETFVSLLDYNNDGLTKVIGQYDDRNNQVDPLAIGIKTCLGKNALTRENIQSGIKVYEAGIEKLGYSPIETAVGNSANRFVSIAVDPATDVEEFTSAFTEGMLRFENYIEESDKFDLLTRVTGGETLSIIADRHNTTVESLEALNDIENGRILANSTIKVGHYSNTLTDKTIVINGAEKGKTY